MDSPIVILGAGPAGLTTAWRLTQQGLPVVLLEKEDQVGGLGRTMTTNGYRLDFGPHTFHARETQESNRILKELMPFFGEDPHLLQRGTRLLLHGRFFRYPLRIGELLAGIRPTLALRILWDYLKANAALRFYPPSKEASFEEWGVRNLGRTLYDLCFGIYSKKVWGLPTSQISSRQAQRVAKLNLTEVILRSLGLKVDPVVYFNRYLYPRDGIGQLYQRMAQAVQEAGGRILLNAPVARLIRQGSRIQRVVYTSGGQEETLDCHGVVSTLPLPLIVRFFDPPLDPEIRERAERLRYRSLQFCYLALNEERIADFHWCYLLDEHFRCNRLSEQKNVSPEMLPLEKTVLLFELSCTRGDRIWNATQEELYEIVLADFKRTPLWRDPSTIDGFFSRRVEYAYPVYEMGFEENLFPVLEALHRLDNFLSLGRHGLFLNNSMDDNVLLAFQVADFVSHEKANPHWGGYRWFEQMADFMHLRFQGK